MNQDYKERRKQRRKRTTQILEDGSDLSNKEEVEQSEGIPEDEPIESRKERRSAPGKIRSRKNVSESVDPYSNDEIPNPDTQTAIIENHREKSRELAQRIGDENPNEVIEELHVVRDKIKDKIKQSLADQLEKVAKQEEIDGEEVEKKEKHNELNLDLTSARYSNPSETLRESSLQRIKQIKQQAAMKSAYRLTGSSSARREPTRFDSDATLREEKKPEKIEEQQSARKRFQKLGQSVLQDIHIPNREEQFDFFTSNKFVQEPSGVTVPTSTTAEATTTSEIVQADTETTLLLQGDEGVETVYTKAVYLSHEKKKDLDGKLYFFPSSKNIPFKRKFGQEDKHPRFLESEGFYVGIKPYMTNANKNLMADRLLKLPDQRGMKWFGVDGELVALPNPIKYVSTRPSFNPNYSAELETEYRRAIYLEDFSDNLNNGNPNMKNITRYQIDLDINQIQFSYHHLFSAEHVLAFKLKNMYKHFILTQEQNLIEILTAKLKALKEAESHFKSELNTQTNKTAADRNMYVESTSTVIKTKLNIESSARQSTNDINQLRAYRNEIKQTRRQRDNEMMLKKNLTEKILLTWKELKDIRIKQQFRNTDIKLIIKRKEVNKQKEEKNFDKDLRQELEEVINEKQEEYHHELSIYEQKSKAYKLQKIRKEEAKKRLDQRKEQNENPEAASNFNIKLANEMREMEQKDIKILSEEDLVEPIKPEEINANKEKDELTKKYNQVRKVIGEPLLFFDLVEENSSISSYNECSREEQNRRNKLLRTKVYVKIIFNGKLVFTTTESPLQNDFTVRWAQIFNIFMYTFPDSILLQIYEHSDSKSNEQMISEINLPMPDANCTSLNYNLENYEFSSSVAFYMHLKATNQIDLFFTTGTLKAGAGWAVSEKDGKVLVPTKFSKLSHSETAVKYDEIKSFDAIAALGVSRMQDIEKLAKWVVKSNLDPNDPRNSDLISLIKNLTTMNEGDFDGLKLPEHFRLNQMSAEFDFVSEEDLEKNKRFRLITLRTLDEPEFKGLKFLPIDERHVKKDAFDLYEKRKLKDASVDDDDEEDNKNASPLKTVKEMKNEIEEARAAGQRYIRKIRRQILAQFKFIQSQKSIQDMVIEEQVPNITALGALFYSLYVEPKRPLYPTRRERKKITGQNVDPEDVRILINVVNAYDLPVRKDKLTNDPMKTIKDPVSGKSIKIHEHIAGDSLVRPFVEVTFQETVYRTSTADGPNASWNQEIHLPFKAPNKNLKPESLQTCRDNIYFNIYDEVEIDALEDERDRDHVVHKKIMRYWLGTLKIPFSTIYFKSKIEGTFKLESPPLMLGYTRDPRLSRIQTSLLDTAINLDTPFRESSYLTLFITIEPQLLVPEIFRETYDSIENLDLLKSIVDWSLVLVKKFPEREFRPTVMNTDGKSVIITRYFRPIKPPPELIENGESSEQSTMNVARFVSLIPYVNDSLIFPGLCDVWSTCTEFLEILSGDEEEHAVLLANLFLGLGKKTWLLLGSSITNGTGVYVLTIENTDYTIWYQGEPFKANEPHNPIKVVSAIANAENIWANVQPYHEPNRIKFDLNDQKCWQRFFNKSNNLELPSVQNETLRYFKTELKFVRELESRIESKLKQKIQEWRPRHITRYNRYGSSALRVILSNMENNRNLPIQNQIEPEELKQLETQFRISGFPINLPYTNLTDIFEAVKATQVHAIPTSECEFALGVHINPYPNTIMSVWIYIAVLIRKDR